MSTQIDRILSLARLHIGRGETGANNSGEYVEYLHRGVRRKGNWCAAFVATIFEDSATCPAIPTRKRRGAKALCKYLANDLTTGLWVAEPRRGRAPKQIHMPAAGDTIAWHRSPGASSWKEFWRDWRGHVELIESYEPLTDTLVTIAGNVGKFPANVKRRYHRNGSWRKRLFGISRLGALHSI